MGTQLVLSAPPLNFARLKYHPPKDNVLLFSAECDWEYQCSEHWRELIREELEVQYI